MSQSEEINELSAALVAFQGAMPAVPKTSTNPFFNSKYADLADVVEVAKPLLKEHGLAVSQNPSYVVVNGELHHTLKTKVVHTSGQWQEDEMVLLLSKDDSQGQGSALTYTRRYAYSAALGIVSDEDDDGAGQSAARAERNAGSGAPGEVVKLVPLAEKNALIKRVDALPERQKAEVYAELSAANVNLRRPLPETQREEVERILASHEQKELATT